MEKKKVSLGHSNNRIVRYSDGSTVVRCSDRNCIFVIQDELRSNFADDVKLVSSQCPKLKSLRLSIFGETVFLRHDDLQIWKPVETSLLALKELVLQSHTW